MMGWRPDVVGFEHERGHSECAEFGLLVCFDSNGDRIGELTQAAARQAIGAPLKARLRDGTTVDVAMR